MNAPAAAIVATEADQIENALDALIAAAIQTDRSPIIPSRGPVSAGVRVMEFLDRLDTWTPAQRKAGVLLSNPVSEALRQAVTTLGERLHEIGGMRLMQDTCDRVAQRDPRHEARRISIMDARWDGIGNWLS